MAGDVSHFGLAEDELPSGWSADRLDELAVFNPEQISNDYPHSQIAYLDISNIAAGVIGEAVPLSLASAPSRAKRIVRPHDSILSTVRPGNRAYAFLRDIPHNLIVSTGFAVLRARPKKADARFLYYLATSDPIIDYLASIAEEKTAYPSVNPNDIAECIVPIPPLPEQRAIAHILGTLDDKIELNRRMNETLEAMARAIFKSWFVNFDPVRAKIEGRDLGLPKEMADLFPDRFKDSELGEIPSGWVVCCLKDIAKITYGTNLPAHSMLDKGVPVYGAAGMVGYYSEAMFSEPVVLVTSRGSGSGTVHETDGPAFVTNNSFTIVPMESWFSRHLLRWSLLNADIASFVTGSAQPQLTITNFERLKLLVPTEAVVAAFHAIADPLWTKAAANRVESRTLAAIRDALLPKLLSGELRLASQE